MKKILIPLLLMAQVCYGQFPTNQNNATLTLDSLGNDFTDFYFTINAYEDQEFTFTIETNDNKSLDISSESALFKSKKRVAGGSNLVFILKNVGDITMSTSNITFSLSKTNIPPDGIYKSQLVLTDNTTNVLRNLGRGIIDVQESLFDDVDGTFQNPGFTNLTDFLTIVAASTTFWQIAENNIADGSTTQTMDDAVITNLSIKSNLDAGGNKGTNVADAVAEDHWPSFAQTKDASILTNTLSAIDISAGTNINGANIASGDIASARLTVNGVVVSDFTQDSGILVGTGSGTFAEETGATLRTSIGVAIGTDVLAQQTIGIADNNLLEVDGSPNSDEYARFTASGLEGRTEAEFKADFNLEIGTDVQAFDSDLDTFASQSEAAYLRLNRNNVMSGSTTNTFYDGITTNLGTFAKVHIRGDLDGGVSDDYIYWGGFGTITSAVFVIGNDTDDDEFVIATGTSVRVASPSIAVQKSSGKVFFGKGINILSDSDLRADLLLHDDSSIQIDATADGMADDKYNGITITGLSAGENLTQWDLVFLQSDAKFDQADADAAGEFPAWGIVTTSASDAGAIVILTHGVVRNEGWTGLTVGGKVYLSDTAGEKTQTAPSTSGDAVQIVGIAISDSEIYFNFGDMSYLEVE